MSAALKKMATSIQTLKADYQYSESTPTSSGYEISQRGVYSRKGTSLVKIESHFPNRKITLVRGTLAITADSDSQERQQDRLPDPPVQFLTRTITSLSQPLSLLPYVQLKMTGKSGKEWVLTGIPLLKLQTFGKVQYFLSPDSLLPVQRMVFNKDGGLSQVAHYEYEKVGDTYAPSKVSALFTATGGAKIIELRFSNMRVNTTLPDSDFLLPF